MRSDRRTETGTPTTTTTSLSPSLQCVPTLQEAERDAEAGVQLELDPRAKLQRLYHTTPRKGEALFRFLSFSRTTCICLSLFLSSFSSRRPGRMVGCQSMRPIINHAHSRETCSMQYSNVSWGLEPGLDIAITLRPCTSLQRPSTCLSLCIRLPGFPSPFFMSLLFRSSGPPPFLCRQPIRHT